MMDKTMEIGKKYLPLGSTPNEVNIKAKMRRDTIPQRRIQYLKGACFAYTFFPYSQMR